MPDLTEQMDYRGFVLNDPDIAENIVSGKAAGSVIDSADWSDVDVVQFTEKRSEDDGMDAGPVFLGGRRLRVAGTLYDTSRPLLYDRLRALRAALSPTLAFREDPSRKGYLDLNYVEPTTDEAYSGDAFKIALRMEALPRLVGWVEQRDRIGGNAADALAIPYQATFTTINPRVLSQQPVTLNLDGTGSVFSGEVLNRGNYHVPFNMLIRCTAAGGVVSVAIGGSTFTLTIPTAAGDQIIRYRGFDKLITAEVAGQQTNKMGYIDFPTAVAWPLIGGGSVPYTIDATGITLIDDEDGQSHLWFWEGYA